MPSKTAESVAGVMSDLHMPTAVDIINEAIMARDHTRLRGLLILRPYLNVSDSCGRVPLRLAADISDQDAISILLQAGADPLKGYDTATQMTPWKAAAIAAAYDGNADALVTFITHGTNINEAMDNGWTPLIMTAGANSLVMKQLLDLGADPNCTDNNGSTPLMHAVAVDSCYGDENDAFERVRILLDAGADQHITNQAGRTASDILNRQEQAPAVRQKIADLLHNTK